MEAATSGTVRPRAHKPQCNVALQNDPQNTPGSHLKHLAMASVDTLGRADKAVESGWKAAVTIRDRKAPGSRKPQLRTIPEWDGKTYTTPAGREVPLCPAQISNRDCNTCGWCDPRNYEAPPIVGFLIH